MTPPIPLPTASAEIATMTINAAEVAIAAMPAELLLLGERECNGRGAEGLTEVATAGVRGRSPDHYSRAGVTGGATVGVTIAAVAGGESAGAKGEGESRHRRMGERRQYRRKIVGITGGAAANRG